MLGATAGKTRDREAWQDGDIGKQADQTFGAILKQNEKSMSRTQKLISKINSQPEGYAECYPGFEEMHDAIEDSDEETDYSKMDPVIYFQSPLFSSPYYLRNVCLNI